MKAFTLKPIVQCHDAHMERREGREVLICTPVNHPDKSLNEKRIISSTVQSVDPLVKFIETQNTVYEVLSWSELQGAENVIR